MTESNKTPNHSTFDSRNHALRNAIACREHTLFFSARPNRSYDRGRQFSCVVICARDNTAPMPAFSHFIGNIVRMRASRKMRGIHARRIVTTVRNHANRQRIQSNTAAQRKSNTVRIHNRATTPAEPDLTIAIRCSRRLPFPTLIGRATTDFSPETLNEIWSHSLNIANKYEASK